MDTSETAVFMKIDVRILIKSIILSNFIIYISIAKVACHNGNYVALCELLINYWVSYLPFCKLVALTINIIGGFCSKYLFLCTS